MVRKPNTEDAVSSAPMADKNLMIDIETLDTSITSAIIAIGAVTFDPRGAIYDDETFLLTVSKKSNLAHGRTVSDSTVAWWDAQDQDAQDAVFRGPHTPLNLALAEFVRWVNRQVPTCTRIWAKSPDFDCSIMINACTEQNIYWPFKFWESRCVRTIMDLAYPEGDFPHIALEGPKHDALVDAKVQALQVQHSYFVLGC